MVRDGVKFYTVSRIKGDKMKNCIYCQNPTNERTQLCSRECRIKWEAKQENIFIQMGAISPSKKISESDKSLQEKFLKKLGKRKIKSKLIVSGGIL